MSKHVSVRMRNITIAVHGGASTVHFKHTSKQRPFGLYSYSTAIQCQCTHHRCIASFARIRRFSFLQFSRSRYPLSVHVHSNNMPMSMLNLILLVSSTRHRWPIYARVYQKRMNVNAPHNHIRATHISTLYIYSQQISKRKQQLKCSRTYRPKTQKFRMKTIDGASNGTHDSNHACGEKRKRNYTRNIAAGAYTNKCK